MRSCLGCLKMSDNGQGLGKVLLADGDFWCRKTHYMLALGREMVRMLYMTASLTRWKSQVRILYAPPVLSGFFEVSGQGLRQGFCLVPLG